MTQHLSSFILLGVALALVHTGTLFGSEPNSPEQRLREQLRATLLQLRDAQTQSATFQAAQAESDQKNKTLTGQVEALTKRLAADKDSADKTLADLKTKLENREARITDLNDSLEKWKASQKQAADLATSKESQRAKLAGEVITLQQRVADQQTKNAAMYKLGTEILRRYEGFGLGTALAAREPFVGTTRVKFETLIQDYQDNLTEGKIKPSEENATSSKIQGKPKQ